MDMDEKKCVQMTIAAQKMAEALEMWNNDPFYGGWENRARAALEDYRKVAGK